ncbi:diguanylate cyclase (GGDEF)-like protein [Litorivivens lipolytica]|uniref:Diguanylate cyclase (GGDEF)-like protein n=1 Tax=Litorivivens lipolytica TaxID=1524264 RepID=A0A7W4Z5U2_9GAMM|nr:diguanylate cyclase [Litorivivens lipolytica]MBB3047462.1 diguanylate cyclase (GGDEF)-like protein [Litorivivens lipolytica]
MKGSLSRAVGHLVPAELAKQKAELHRYQLFVAVNLSLVVVILLAQIYSVLFSGIPSHTYGWTFGFTIPLQIALIVGVLIFRHAKRFVLAVNLSLAVMFITVSVVVGFLGGPLGSISASMMVAPPVFAFVLLGLKPGIIWAVITYAVIFGASLLQISGFEFPNIAQGPMVQVNELVHASVAFGALILMIVFYELNNQRYRKQLVEVARRDDLTLLPNRTAFYRELQGAIDRYEAKRERFSLVYIDLDNFKPVNDEHGHSAGDRVLQAFAGRLRRAVRSQDFVCRLAGDEFAILLHGTVDHRITQLVLDRLQRQLERPINLRNGNTVRLSASTGLALYPDDARTLEEILHAADERMYRNKRSAQTESTVS